MFWIKIGKHTNWPLKRPASPPEGWLHNIRTRTLLLNKLKHIHKLFSNFYSKYVVCAHNSFSCPLSRRSFVAHSSTLCRGSVARRKDFDILYFHRLYSFTTFCRIRLFCTKQVWPCYEIIHLPSTVAILMVFSSRWIL